MKLSYATKSPTVMREIFISKNNQIVDFDVGCGICHSDHFGSSFKYSFFHLKQKSRYIILSRCHRLTTEIGEIGLELRQASIRASRVENSSKVYLNGPPIFRMWALKLLTLASQRPPMCGGPRGIKCHCLF